MVASDFLLLFILAASWHAQVVDSSIPRSSTAVHHHHPSQPSQSIHHRPAWNASPKINDQGYLCEELYRRMPEWEADCPHTSDPNRQDLHVPVIIRQVPGDGDCLFHAIAISLNLIEHGRHLRMDDPACLWELKDMSRALRQMAVDCLRSPCTSTNRLHKRRMFLSLQKHSSNGLPHKRKARKYKRLFIQGCESMSTTQLLSTAANQYGISSEEYCNLMEQDSYWGGGPEIVALCNVLKRPIHVYELVAVDSTKHGIERREETYNKIRVPDQFINKDFRLRRMATFGSPKYDSKDPLHILSADSRFPDVQPECIRENGNHFMAMFPVDVMRKWVNTTTACEENKQSKRFDSDRKRRVRGGAAAAVNPAENNVCGGLFLEEDESVEEEEESWLFHGEWFNDFNFSAMIEDEHEWDIEKESSLGVSNKKWYRKLLMSGGRKQMKESQPRQSMKQIIEFWINVFVWTLSHFHVGF